ncbi:MAG: hypothetical protein NTX45_16930 [Proteobacteria bacterium]|nr:hypothetical protein [Pseudomonadota bacterium]
MNTPTQATPENRPNSNETTPQARTSLVFVRDKKQGGQGHANP